MANSCQLFHGPGAREAALKRASEIGRLAAPPFGDSGLGVDESRAIVEILLSIPVGEDPEVVVIGPIDNAKSIRAMDSLLKSIEEIPSQFMIPILWAEDLGGVIPTIRSRCLETWSPGTFETNPELLALATQIVEDALSGRFYTIPEAVIRSKTISVEVSTEEGESEEGETTKSKFKGMDLLWALTDVLAPGISDPRKRDLWERLRKIAHWRNPTVIEIVSALVG